MPDDYPEMLNPADWSVSRLTAMEPQELLEFTQRAIAEYKMVEVLEREDDEHAGMVEVTLPGSVAPILEEARAHLSEKFGREFTTTEAFTYMIKNSRFADPNYKPPEKKKKPKRKGR